MGLIFNGNSQIELDQLEQLGKDLEQLQRDNRADIPHMLHSEFKAHYLNLFLGRHEESQRTFQDWYMLTGQRSTYVAIHDYVNGQLKEVYRVPPLLNRNGLTQNNYNHNTSLSALMDTATKRAAKLPRLESTVIAAAVTDANLTSVEPDLEALEAWRGLLKYNGYKVKDTFGVTSAQNDTVTYEHQREEISWDEEPWDF